MNKCPFNITCTHGVCDTSCKYFAEYSHWADRCDIKISNPAFKAKVEDIHSADEVLRAAEREDLESAFPHLAATKVNNVVLTTDTLTLYTIHSYCQGIGFYNGVYKLDLYQYFEDIKGTWNNRRPQNSLEDIDIWIKSSRVLIIYNVSMIRFGDFESQTLLRILQDRYDPEKRTIIVVEEKFGFVGKPDSVFFVRLRDELKSRGV